MSDQNPVAVGTLLVGKYRVERELGAGGMGQVLEATHLRLGHSVAIKVLRQEYRESPEVVLRFEREARAAARLRSPHVARVLDVESLDDGSPFIVMEFLQGHDLDMELAQRGRLPPQEAVDRVLEACSAVSEAHDLGVIHRDLKPQNLFLAEESDSVRLKLLDFGISKLADDDVAATITRTHSSLGTPLYMSPEQIRSARSVDHRTDIWSLGVILYELIAGGPPFGGESSSAVIAAITADDPVPLRQYVPEVAEGLEQAVMRALSKKPEDRFQSVAELARAIAPFGSTGTWSAPRSGVPLSRPRAVELAGAPTVDIAHAATRTADPPVDHTAAPLAKATEPTPPAPARRFAVMGLGLAAALGLIAGILLMQRSAKTSHAGAPSVSTAPAPSAAPSAAPSPEAGSPVATASAPPQADSASAQPPASAAPARRAPPKRAPTPPRHPARPPRSARPSHPATPPLENPLHL